MQKFQVLTSNNDGLHERTNNFGCTKIFSSHVGLGLKLKSRGKFFDIFAKTDSGHMFTYVI